ncbi:hypothetical protein PROAA_930030 [Candidatus Propionivibrio aalborgensis]|uniref:Uncharacterized protein n=1 Tax=Candidatus Propionivibrio aalborgensis TaxID=1860101 RepID=A0A1A8Y491_9RHOO|nr:hypothetical protein PROAA_930030 [Candidatus Propionivibrio aalborgensis]
MTLLLQLMCDFSRGGWAERTVPGFSVTGRHQAELGRQLLRLSTRPSQRELGGSAFRTEADI